MKKYYTILTALLASLGLFAQNPQQGGTLQNYVEALQGQQTFCYQAIDELQAEQSLAQYLTQNILQNYPQGTALQLDYSRKSPDGVYYTYNLAYNGSPLYGRQLKALVDNSSTLRWVFHNLQAFAMPANSTLPTTNDVQQFYTQQYSNYTQINNGVVWMQHEGQIAPSFYLTLRNEKIKQTQQYVFAHSGQLLYTNALDRHFAADTPVYAYVYDPDPLTTAHTYYGGAYKNDTATESPELKTQHKKRMIRGTLSGDSVLLANDDFFLGEISNPAWPPTKIALGDTFKQSRLHYSFAEVCAYYHLNTQKSHINGLGFNLPGFKIEVDAHAFSSDASQFASTYSPPALMFGDGGVPDAEDAEVVVHEFGHALAYGASPNTAIGQERRAIDEGLGDYFAVSYTKAIDTFNWTKVFTWDGNNGGWQGRTINYGNKYPSLTNVIWTDGQIWSTSFIRIYDQIGRAESDKLMLEALYRLSANMSMPQLAMAVVQIDSIKNGGKYKFEIECAFGSTGVLSRPQGCTLSVADVEGATEQNLCTLANSYGFADGEDAILYFGKTGTYNLVITDAMGKQVVKETLPFGDGYKQIRGQCFAPGIYFLSVNNQSTGQTQVFKLLRY